MLHNDLVGIGLYFGFIFAVGLPLVLLKAFCKVPFEATRKLYHLAITLSIYPLVKAFSAWYMAVLAVFLFALIVYPLLALVERTSAYQRIAVERADGEFKHSLIIVQGSMALLLFVFWGLLGDAWKYVALVAVMAWGLGDAAAALVGTAVGRRRIYHPRIAGKKTIEGTLAMCFTAALSVFLTLLIEAGQPWQVSLVVALLAAPVCAIVELFTNHGLDTLTVPISAGLAVLSLISLFSFLSA